MANSCFILYRCEDELSFYELPEKDLEINLNNNQYEGITFLQDKDVHNFNLEYFPAMSALIIKGKIIVPTKKEVVTKWEIE